MANNIDTLISGYNTIKSIVVISHNTTIINEINNIITNLNNLKNKINLVFGNFFNDYSISGGDDFNRLKSDSFCSYFNKYKYVKVRNLVFKYLPKHDTYTINVDINSLISTSNSYQTKFENSAISGVDANGQPVDPYAIFWASYQGEYLGVLSPGKNTISNDLSLADGAINNILAWLNYGQQVVTQISRAQAFVGYYDSDTYINESPIYNAYVNNLDAIKTISNTTYDSLNYAKNAIDSNTINLYNNYDLVKENIINSINFENNCENFINQLTTYFTTIYGS